MEPGWHWIPCRFEAPSTRGVPAGPLVEWDNMTVPIIQGPMLFSNGHAPLRFSRSCNWRLPTRSEYRLFLRSIRRIGNNPVLGQDRRLRGRNFLPPTGGSHVPENTNHIRSWNWLPGWTPAPCSNTDL